MGWQPIETAPKDGTYVDIWVPDFGGYRVTNAHWAIHHWLNGRPQSKPAWGPETSDGPPPVPTHWQPLPEPPVTQPKD